MPSQRKKRKNSLFRSGGSSSSNNNCSFPTIPSPSPKHTKKKGLLHIDTTGQVATLNLRERRKRRNTPHSLYRPLSILTQSVLMPFNFDTDRAFDIFKSNDKYEAAGSRKRRIINTSEQRATPKKTLSYEATTPSSISSNAAGLQELPFSHEPTMDLLTALKVTNPDKDSSCHVTADYATIAECPVPDLREHPFFSSLPFSSKSSSPMLYTTSSPEDIRKVHPRKSKSSDRTTKTAESGSQQESLERKKSFFGLAVKTPGSARSKKDAIIDDNSPVANHISSRTNADSSFIVNGTPNSIGSSDHNGESGSSRNSAGPIRKISELFKTKISMERALTPVISSGQYLDLESPNLGRQDLELFLRRTTFSPTYDYNSADGFPRHPNTGRGWRSRNLKCTTCTEGSCACCRRCCCAYKAAVLALETHKEGSLSRQDALLRIQEITKLFPYGKEAPTFLQCTRGFGNSVGCGKMVCPDCCSICPDTACGDTQCKLCKPLMWEECAWHKKNASFYECSLPVDFKIKA